ncbi:MAG: hypothetical protein SFV17_05425 [Candidatus Obscuribacter sp.]|nr:hypothetical protein [Candidatus Obscuribacter sp.]
MNLNTPSLLLFVHFQPGIVENAPLASIDAALALVKLYRGNKLPVILLELSDYPPTCSWLTGVLYSGAQSVDAYEVLVVKSDSTDGASAIIQACRDSGVSLERIQACGFLSYACLYDTVAGLSRRLEQTRIEVVKSACDDFIGDDWVLFERLPGVSLLN